jgi:hypothetical protein
MQALGACNAADQETKFARQLFANRSAVSRTKTNGNWLLELQSVTVMTHALAD